MRSNVLFRLPVFLLLLFAIGCESKNVGKLEGTRWRSEPSKVKSQHVPEGYLQLEFARDGGLVYRAGGLTFHGTYTLGMGNRVTFHLDKPLAGRKTHSETIEVRHGQITVTDSDGTAMNFRKN